MGEMQVTAVEPNQEGSLRTQRTDARDMLTAEVFHETNVVLDIRQHLLTVILAMTEGCYRGNRSEKRRLAKPVARILGNKIIGAPIRVSYHNRVGGKRSSFSPTFVFRPQTLPYVRFRIRRFLFWVPFDV